MKDYGEKYRKAFLNGYKRDLFWEKLEWLALLLIVLFFGINIWSVL